MHAAMSGSCKTNARAPYQNFPLTGGSCRLGSYADCSDSSHFLSKCSFLPDQDCRYIAKVRLIADVLDHSSEPETTPVPDKLDTNDIAPSQALRSSLYRLSSGYEIHRTDTQHLGCHVTQSGYSHVPFACETYP